MSPMGSKDGVSCLIYIRQSTIRVRFNTNCLRFTNTNNPNNTNEPYGL